jgi:exonuclease III
MKIISWNIERPKINQRSKISFIENTIKAQEPDLVILTETNHCIELGEKFSVMHSEILPSFHENQTYYEKENRVSIFSKFSIKSQTKTYDPYTSICGVIDTDFGELTVYASIIGSFGGRGMEFENDLKHQKNEIENVKGNICFSGDFNIAFSGWKYPSKEVINETKSFLNDLNLKILTEENKDSVLHIVMNENFLKNKKIINKVITIDRKISDHNLIICTIDEP